MKYTSRLEVRFELPSGLELRVFHVSGRERISEPYFFDVEFVRADGGAAKPCELAEPGVLVFSRNGEDVRKIFGVVAELERRLVYGDHGPSFRARLCPRMNFLSLVQKQDVYMEQSVVDIFKSTLAMFGIDGPDDVDFERFAAKYPARDFVVQYAESDLSFIRRLAEHVGISFFFEHRRGSDRLVFTDANVGFRHHRKPTTLVVATERADEGGVVSLNAVERMTSRQFVVSDYNYRTPDLEISGASKAAFGTGGGVVAWGDHLKTPEEAAALANIRAEESAAWQSVYRGTSQLVELASGTHYALEGAGVDGVRVLMAEVEHELRQPLGLHGSEAEPARYENTFVATDAARPFRPQRLTKKPVIAGLVTGIIAGRVPGKDEIAAPIDEHGRYIVRFLFDTVADGERMASRPVRMAQPSVGADYGVQFPNHAGTEVLMAFVNGDPDRPIIVGAVHNALTPAHVTTESAVDNVIRTASGITMRFRDLA